MYASRFDITPEFLTHLCAYNLKTGDYQRHLFEDTWISQAPLEEIIEYLRSKSSGMLELKPPVLHHHGFPASMWSRNMHMPWQRRSG